MKRIRQVVDALGEFVDAVADGVDDAAELEDEIRLRLQKKLSLQAINQKLGWTEISPGVHARPTPRERIIRRRRA